MYFALEQHRSLVSVIGSSSRHEALGRTAVLFSLRVQEWEDRQSPQLLRYADPDGTTRSGSCMGTGDGVTSPARFSCSMSNAVGNCCRMHFAGRTGAFLEQTDGGGTPFSVSEDHRMMERESLFGFWARIVDSTN